MRMVSAEAVHDSPSLCLDHVLSTICKLIINNCEYD
jgi:hypothetical protein